MASELIKDTTKKDFDDDIVDGVSLVDFWADWCAPCHMLAPVVEQLAEKYKGQVKVFKVNIDNEPALAGKYGIRGIPTLMVFKDGKQVETLVGVRPAADIEEALKAQL